MCALLCPPVSRWGQPVRHPRGLRGLRHADGPLAHGGLHVDAQGPGRRGRHREQAVRRGGVRTRAGGHWGGVTTPARSHLCSQPWRRLGWCWGCGPGFQQHAPSLSHVLCCGVFVFFVLFFPVQLRRDLGSGHGRVLRPRHQLLAARGVHGHPEELPGRSGAPRAALCCRGVRRGLVPQQVGNRPASSSSDALACTGEPPHLLLTDVLALA